MTQSINQERTIIRFPYLDENLRQKYVKPRPAQPFLGTNVIPAETNGWDTVFAIRIGDVNNAIALQAGVISSISVSIEQVIAKGAAEAMPPIDPLVSAATNPIKWPTPADFILNDAQINGTFQLLGDPNFADSPAQLQAITQKAG